MWKARATSYDMSQEAFQAGTTTILSVLNGEDSVLSAEQDQAAGSGRLS